VYTFKVTNIITVHQVEWFWLVKTQITSQISTFGHIVWNISPLIIHQMTTGILRHEVTLHRCHISAFLGYSLSERCSFHLSWVPVFISQKSNCNKRYWHTHTNTASSRLELVKHWFDLKTFPKHTEKCPYSQLEVQTAAYF